MPLNMSYDSDSDDDAPKKTERKVSSNKAPSLSDTEAFPETLGGGAPVETSEVPNFASLSFQQDEFDLNKPVAMVRKPITRLPRVRDMYKARDVVNKPLSNGWTLYVDNGIQGPEKQAECESEKCGTAEHMREFFPVWNSRSCSSTVASGSHVRMFKTDAHTSPSVLDTTLEQGGKWAIPVSKSISRGMFEELALYLLDERLGETVVGTVFAIRDDVDVLQIWLKQCPAPDSVSRMTADILSLMGLPEDLTIDFVPHASAFKKSSKARKYFLVEMTPRGLPVDSQATALKPRSKVDTVERKANKKANKSNKAKKGDEGFIDVTSSRSKKPEGKDKSSDSKKAEGGSASASTANPYGDLDFGNDDDHKKGGHQAKETPLVFNKKKLNKPNSRRGSSKKDSKKGGDEFEFLQPQQGAVIPLPIFMAAGAAIILLLAMAVYTYTQSSTQ